MNTINPTNLSSRAVGYQVQIAMLKKANDLAKQQGAAAVDLITQAVEMVDQLNRADPASGRLIDVRA